MYVKRDFLLIFYTVQPQNFDLLGTVEQPLIQVVVLKSNRDFKIGDYGLPTVGREAFGTGTRQRALP